MTLTNVGDETLVAWTAVINFADNTEIIENGSYQDFADATINGSTLTLQSITGGTHNNIESGGTLTRVITLYLPIDKEYEVLGASFNYEYLQHGGNNDPSDFSVDVGEINYRFIRNRDCETYDPVPGHFQCEYSVIATNNSSSPVLASFGVVQDSQIVKILYSNYKIINDYTLELHWWDGEVIAPGGTKQEIQVTFETTSQNAMPTIVSAQ